jgi:CO/xanthine dehydrogenase Mo-binding subunit
MRIPIARALGVPESHIQIIPCCVGGGFGNNASKIWPITALLAKAAGAPVKLTLTREEEFVAGRPFPSAILDVKMGFKKDGTIVAKELNMIMDTGAYVGSNRGILAVTSGRSDNAYRIANIKVSSRLVYTNSVPRGSLRSVGNYLGTYVTESMVDIAADKLGIDPVEIRLKNASQKGDTTVHGFVLSSCRLSDTLKTVREKSDWERKRKARAEYRGIGIACGLHVAGNKTYMPVYEGSSAIVRIDEQGIVSVISGEQDIGQGSATVFAQIAAEEMGVLIEAVKVQPVDTEISPFAKGTFGSRVTVMGGFAVRNAARNARAELLDCAASVLGCEVNDLDLRAGKFYIGGSHREAASFREIARQTVLLRSGLPIMGMGSYSTPDLVVEDGPKHDYYGNYSIAYTFLSQAAEVVVDPDTGQVHVSDFWVAVDLGKAINPKACEGQVEGGVVMGMGYALSEEYLFDGGKVSNPNFTDYKIASASNAPRIHSCFLETPDPNTPYGAKSIGEAVINPAAPAVVNAICNAIGVRITDLPITSEKILQALREKKIETAGIAPVRREESERDAIELSRTRLDG